MEPPFRRPLGFHRLAFGPFRLALLDPQFLKVHVRRIKHPARIPRRRSLFALKILQLLRREFLLARERRRQGPQERRLRDVGRAQMRGDLTPDLVAGIVDLDALVVFAVETDARHVQGVVGGGFFRARRLAFLRRHLDARHFALLEKHPRGVVRAVAAAAHGPGLFHEAAVGPAVDADGALEFRHFHRAAVEEGGDLAPDLRAGLVDFERAVFFAREGDFGGIVAGGVWVWAFGRGGFGGGFGGLESFLPWW